MILTEQLEIRYIPRVGGNQELPKEQQIVVTLKLPTALERSKWSTLRYHGNGQGLNDLKIEIDQDIENVILACVLSIEGIELKQKNGSVRRIRAAKELLEVRSAVVSALVQELATVLLQADQIPEEDEKK